MIIDYRQLDDSRATTLIQRLGDWLLINGEVVKGIWSYPTQEQVLLREGKPAQGKSMRALLRLPEVFLHRDSGQFSVGHPLRVLCRPESPDFVLSEFEYSDGHLYRVVLSEAQSAPVDTAGRKWQ